MIVRINTNSKTANVISYNENKVKQGEARCLALSNGLIGTTAHSSTITKKRLFESYEVKNEGIKNPGLHISLSFHPDEELSDKKLLQIGEEYMQKLGYGQQPFLIYRHEDRAHPHIHIVSVTINKQGRKMNDSFQRQRSNTIRKELEIKYGLVKAEQQGKNQLMTHLLPEQLDTYSEKQTKKAIGNIVRTALGDYSFSSLTTFRAFLAQHQIKLNLQQGTTSGGKPYQGVTFQLLDAEKHQPITPYVKASSFAFAPTAERLAMAFKKGAQKINKQYGQTRLKIDRVRASLPPGQREQYPHALRQHGIQLLQTSQGYVYVDHSSRIVLSQQELPASYGQQEVIRWQQQTSPMPAQKLPVSAAVRPVEPRLNEQQRLALQSRVSHHYQRIRQTGLEGQKPVYFESSLIEQFPASRLTRALLEEGYTQAAASQAVTQFESYKQQQLPAIKAKEQDYFETTASALTTLAATLPVEQTCKHQFLTALGYHYDPGRGTLVHQQKKELSLTLTEPQRRAISQSSGPVIPVGERFSRVERQFLLATATGQPLPKTLSKYQLNITRLMSLLGPDHLRQHWPQLNAAYRDQMLALRPAQASLQTFLQDRGMVLESGPDGTVRLGYVKSPVESYQPLPAHLAKFLGKLPPVAIQQQRLLTGAGSRLIQLSQAIDTGDQNRQRFLVNQVGRTLKPGEEDIIQTPLQLQTWFRNQADQILQRQQELLRYLESNQPDTRMSLGRFLSVPLPVLLAQTPPENQLPIRAAYLRKHTELIIDHELKASSGPVSLMTMLESLYKRGVGVAYVDLPQKGSRQFLLRSLGQKPDVQIILPQVLKQQIDSIPFPGSTQPVLIRDSQWIEPTTSRYRQLTQLTSTLDQNKPIDKQIQQLNVAYPGLPTDPANLVNVLLQRPSGQTYQPVADEWKKPWQELTNSVWQNVDKDGLLDTLGDALSTRNQSVRKYRGGDRDTRHRPRKPKR